MGGSEGKAVLGLFLNEVTIGCLNEGAGSERVVTGGSVGEHSDTWLWI